MSETVVSASLAGVRVDRAVSILTGASRSAAAELVACGGVKVDGATAVQASRKLREGESFGIDDDRVTSLAVEPPRVGAAAGVAFEVVYDDEHVIVVDKPAGLVVHPGAGHSGDTLVDGLVVRYPDLLERAGLGTDPSRPGIVHRLDKGTSGLMVVARTPEAHSSLSEQLRAKTARREYLALVAGELEHRDGVVDAPIGRSARVATRMAVTPNGKQARTSYRVIERLGPDPACTLIEARLETGRTHQVRVHMAAIGHPVGGDDRYGDTSRALALMAVTAQRTEPGRLFLHAHRLTIDHPNGEKMTWTSPLPEDLEAVLAQRREPPSARGPQAAR